jgi:hypothetical protein
MPVSTLGVRTLDSGSAALGIDRPTPARAALHALPW